MEWTRLKSRGTSDSSSAARSGHRAIAFGQWVLFFGGKTPLSKTPSAEAVLLDTKTCTLSDVKSKNPQQYQPPGRIDFGMTKVPATASLLARQLSAQSQAQSPNSGGGGGGGGGGFSIALNKSDTFTTLSNVSQSAAAAIAANPGSPPPAASRYAMQTDGAPLSSRTSTFDSRALNQSFPAGFLAYLKESPNNKRGSASVQPNNSSAPPQQQPSLPAGGSSPPSPSGSNETRIFVFGGSTGDDLTSDLSVLHLNSMQWSAVRCYGQPPRPLEGHTLTYMKVVAPPPVTEMPSLAVMSSASAAAAAAAAASLPPSSMLSNAAPNVSIVSSSGNTPSPKQTTPFVPTIVPALKSINTQTAIGANGANTNSNPYQIVINTPKSQQPAAQTANGSPAHAAGGSGGSAGKAKAFAFPIPPAGTRLPNGSPPLTSTGSAAPPPALTLPGATNDNSAATTAAPAPLRIAVVSPDPYIPTTSGGAAPVVSTGNISPTNANAASAGTLFDRKTSSLLAVSAANASPRNSKSGVSGWSGGSPYLSAPEDRLYVFGGHTTVFEYSNELYLFDLRDNRWSIVETNKAPIPRMHHSTVVMNGKLYVFGGKGSRGSFNDLHIFDPHKNEWSQPWVRGIYPAGRYGHSACTIEGTKMFVFGGSNGVWCFNDLYVLHASDLTWYKVITTGSLPSPRAYHVCEVVDLRLFIHGGRDGLRRSPDVYCIDVSEFSDRKAEMNHLRRTSLVPENTWQRTDLEFLQTLGTGSFGRVRLVRHKATGGIYACKILKKKEILKMKQVDHILNEKRILSDIDHPFIVNLVNAFQDEQKLYLVMEYVSGGEFYSYLRKVKRFTNSTARFYAAHVVLIFQYLHSKDIVYRDLKPENLLVDSRGHLKMTDFGFAKVVDVRTWTLCGTPEYLAPEILLNKGHGKAVDWWSLGILIYEMLAGHPPFVDERPMGIYQKILAGKIYWPQTFNEHAKDLISKLLHQDITKRLGNLKNGVADVRNHKFFRGFDWKALYNCNVPPPWIPTVQGATDTRNFEKYPDSIDASAVIPGAVPTSPTSAAAAAAAGLLPGAVASPHPSASAPGSEYESKVDPFREF